ncbi:MAG: hypothetical protein IJK52_03995, partial [Oscillospiraceae bacterium]|nr:hypothetical protein [Oscillospiraceae bacterium]
MTEIIVAIIGVAGEIIAALIPDSSPKTKRMGGIFVVIVLGCLCVFLLGRGIYSVIQAHQPSEIDEGIDIADGDTEESDMGEATFSPLLETISAG